MIVNRISYTLMGPIICLMAQHVCGQSSSGNNRAPVQYEATLIFPAGATNASFDLPVSADVRLAIEYASCAASLSIQDRLAIRIGTVVRGSLAHHYIVAAPQTATQTVETPGKIYTCGQLVKSYADPGTTIRFEAFRTTS